MNAFYATQKVEVKDFEKFNNYDYKVLYNEQTQKDINKRKTIDDTKELT